MLTLNRPGNYPQSGNTNILMDKKENPSFIVTKFTDIWKQFDEHGYLVLSQQAKRNGNGFYGAASVTCNIDSGEEQTLTVILSLERDISRLSNPITGKENAINPRDQDHVNDFPFSCSDICKNDPKSRSVHPSL